jgi:hypothetical protein
VPFLPKAATFRRRMRLPVSLSSAKSWLFAKATPLAFAALALAAPALVACQPNIGDDCTNHAECAYSGSRICEPNLPGGYCTIFNCEPGSCPDEAVCVAYNSVPSPRPECADPSDRRLQRTFCMKACSSRSDCRTDDGYDCVDLSDPKQNPWDAVVVERGSYSRKICTVPLSGDFSPVTGETSAAGVCSPSTQTDASFPTPPPLDAGGSDANAPRGDASTPPFTDAGARDAR